MTNDMTFCSFEECDCTDCYRHQCNVVGKPQFLSIADFKDTNICIRNKEVLENYKMLYPHIGHKIELIKDVNSINILCNTCNTVLYGVDKYGE